MVPDLTCESCAGLHTVGPDGLTKPLLRRLVFALFLAQHEALHEHLKEFPVCAGGSLWVRHLTGAGLRKSCVLFLLILVFVETHCICSHVHLIE